MRDTERLTNLLARKQISQYIHSVHLNLMIYVLLYDTASDTTVNWVGHIYTEQ